MKMKSLAMLAMSGLLAASFAYVSPALADDLNGEDQAAMQAATGDSSNMQTGQPGQDSQGSNPNTPDSTNVSGANADNNDDGNPVQDTPSGDDDY